MAKKNEKEEVNGGKKNVVYYITLTAAGTTGKPQDKYFTFDVGSKMDLENTSVKVLDCHDLLHMYRSRHGEKTTEDVTAYDLVDDLIESNDSNPGECYFIDECPFIELEHSKFNC